MHCGSCVGDILAQALRSEHFHGGALREYLLDEVEGRGDAVGEDRPAVHRFGLLLAVVQRQGAEIVRLKRLYPQLDFRRLLADYDAEVVAEKALRIEV